MPASVRAYLAEPAIAGAPTRVWRDWALVAAASIAALLEAALRTDADFADLPLGWRIASVVAFFAVVPYALLVRRTHPLRSVAIAFGVAVGFGALMAIVEGPFGGLDSTAVVLVAAYALYRWGSGRDGAIGGVILLGALIAGNLIDATNVSDVVGGSIVLVLPVVLGRMVRYGRVARARAISEANAREREALARELHDTVAHHVSAIAVQAQAGQAVAARDPMRAVSVLATIEEAASRTLEEMRAIVHTLRAGEEPDLAPQRGVADLHRLADNVAGGLRVVVVVDPGLSPSLAETSPALGAAIYRIAQESITNVVRHARRATCVRVRVTADGDCVRVTVTDDGERAATTHRFGFGLLGMAERAQLLGGSLHAGPAPGRGWQVTAELPRARAS